MSAREEADRIVRIYASRIDADGRLVFSLNLRDAIESTLLAARADERERAAKVADDMRARKELRNT